jgi:hypothetical protein
MEKEKDRISEFKERDYLRAKVFWERKIPVHIALKSGTFYNGYIAEEPTLDFFFIDDCMQGNKDGKKLIFFIELIKPIDEFKERR